MNDLEILKRKVKLKRQTIKGLQEEIRDIQARRFLLALRDSLSAKMTNYPDRELSSQLDCIDSLLRSLGQ